MRGKAWLIVAIAGVLAACASPPPPQPFDALIGQPGVVTLTNLHPDEPRSRLFAVNYQQAGLIPVCTAVTLLERNAKRLVFRNDASGKTYEYYYHEAALEPFGDHLARYFGTSCPRAALDRLPTLDRQGVAHGKALVGMSRQGVIFAMGYPPPHATPSLDGNRWLYWTNRFNKVAVLFDDTGHVLAIEN
jgi:hypothetical protein